MYRYRKPRKKKILILNIIAILLLLSTLFVIFTFCRTGEDEAPIEEAQEAIPTPAPTPEATPAPTTDVVAVEPRPGHMLTHPDGTPLTRAEILEVTEFTAPNGSLIFGDTGRLSGNWISGFDSSPKSEHVREWMHGGRSTMTITKNGHFVKNPMVVRSWTSIDNPDGTRTFTFHIYDDNLWSDGHPITAIDYVFNIFLTSSPQFGEIGGFDVSGEALYGFREFLDGVELEGERVPILGVTGVLFWGIGFEGTDTFWVTVAADRIPFVFDFHLRNWEPRPFHVWSRGGTQFQLESTVEGARVTEGFTAEWLDELVNSPGGERFNPSAVAGAYLLESWDESAGSVILVRNPYFTATWDGFSPSIERLVMTHVDSAAQIHALGTGQIHIVTGLRAGAHIQAGWDLVHGLGEHSAISYPRNGYGFVSWHGDHGPTQFSHVRRAIAWLLDREEFTRLFTGGWGFVQQGPYALGGWEFSMRGETLYADQKFTRYKLSLADALRELVENGWVLNDRGEPFQDGVDEVRYKEVDGELMRLTIRWASNDHPMTPIMRGMLVPNAAAVGMEIVEYMYTPPNVNLHANARVPGSPYAPGGEMFRHYHMFTLAAGVATPDTPWTAWTTNPHYARHGFNTTWHGDRTLAEIAYQMRDVNPNEPDWEERFLDLWVEFQVRFNYVLPMLPLYTEEYHDFHATWLGNWHTNAIWDRRHAALRAVVERNLF